MSTTGVCVAYSLLFITCCISDYLAHTSKPLSPTFCDPPPFHRHLLLSPIPAEAGDSGNGRDWWALVNRSSSAEGRGH